MSKSRENILAKIRRRRKNFLYGTLIAGASVGGFKGYEMLRFELAAGEILRYEGGYANSKKIDQETKYGVTNPTLKQFKKKFPQEAEGFPEEVKDISRAQAKKIMRLAFYEHYKINEINNNSLSEMLLDAIYNHDYNTFRNFAKEGLIAVMKLRGENIDNRPRNWKDVPPFLNECTNKEQEAFYNAFVQARINFFERDGYIKKYKGLKKRAAKFVGKYRRYAQNTDDVREKFSGEYQAQKQQNISWNTALRVVQQERS